MARSIIWLDGEELPVTMTVPDTVLPGLVFVGCIGVGATASVYKVQWEGAFYAARVSLCDDTTSVMLTTAATLAELEVGPKILSSTLFDADVALNDHMACQTNKVQVCVVVMELFDTNLKAAPIDMIYKYRVELVIWLRKAKTLLETKRIFHSDMGPQQVVCTWTPTLKVRIIDAEPYDGDYEENWASLFEALRGTPSLPLPEE